MPRFSPRSSPRVSAERLVSVPLMLAAAERAYLDAIDRWNRSPHGGRFPEWDRPVRRRQLELLLAHVPAQGMVVDVGTGPGIVPAALLEADRRVLAVDLPGGGSIVAEWLRARGAHVEHAVVGPDPIPAGDEVADAVLLADVVEHLPGSPIPLLREIHRVLRRGGLLVLTTPNATRLHARLRLLAGRSVWAPLEVVLGPDAVHPSHHREYTRSELERVLELAGFEVQHVQMVEERLLRIVPAWVARGFHTLAPSLSGDIVVAALKP
jgi:SAM-dependent methyltransferase